MHEITDDEYRQAALGAINLLENRGYNPKQIRVICIGIVECIDDMYKNKDKE